MIHIRNSKTVRLVGNYRLARGPELPQLPTKCSKTVHLVGNYRLAGGSEPPKLPTKSSKTVRLVGISRFARGSEQSQIPTKNSKTVRLVGISLLGRGSFTIEISWIVLRLLYSDKIHRRRSGVKYPDFLLSCTSWEVSCSLRVQTCPTAKSSCSYYRITVSGFHLLLCPVYLITVSSRVPPFGNSRITAKTAPLESRRCNSASAQHSCHPNSRQAESGSIRRSDSRKKITSVKKEILNGFFASIAPSFLT